jgi:hypothetical protein
MASGGHVRELGREFLVRMRYQVVALRGFCTDHGMLDDAHPSAISPALAPIPASSGNTNRHRLNPFGDGQLNRALDVVART